MYKKMNHKGGKNMFSLFHFNFLLLGLILDLVSHGNDRKYLYFFVFNLVLIILRIVSLFVIIPHLIVILYWLWAKYKDKQVYFYSLLSTTNFFSIEGLTVLCYVIGIVDLVVGIIFKLDIHNLI